MKTKTLPIRTLTSCLALALGIAFVASTAQAVPYASQVTKNGNTVSFVLSQAAAGITVLRDGANPVTPAIDASTKGVKTFDMTGYTTYSIIVTGDTAKVWTQISSDSLTQSKYYSPRGVTVDTNPKRSTFGQIIVSEGLGGAVGAGGRTTTDGLYIMSADQGDVLGQGDTGFAGGIDWSTSSSSPFHVSMNRGDPLGQDYTIYIGDWSDTHSGVWTADLVNPNAAFSELLDNTGRDAAGIAWEGGGAGPGQLHGSVPAGPWVEGVGDARIMYTVDEDVLMGSVLQYDIGTTTSGYSTAPTVRVDDGGVIGNGLMDVVRDADGSWWVAQYRYTDTAGVPSLTHWADNSFAPSWKSGTTMALNQAYGSIDIHEYEDLLVMGSSKGLIYVIDILNPDNPKLVNSITHAGSTIRDVAFDAAGNIYVVSPSSETLRIYSAGGLTIATTKSDGTFNLYRPAELSVAATDANAAEEGADTAGFTIRRRYGLDADQLVYFTLSGTAMSNVDYTISPTSPATIPAGQTTLDITVIPVDDSAREATETVVLTLVTNADYNIAINNTATANITDNDLIVRYWDANGADYGAGADPTGTWGGDNFWSTSADGTAATGAWQDWAQAIFSAGADWGTFTVTVSGRQKVDGPSIEDSFVTFSGGTLLLTNFSGISVASPFSATINSVLAGVSGMTKDGPGELVLGGANTYSGPTVVNDGSLKLSAADRIPDLSAVNIGATGTLDLNYFDETIGSLAGTNGAAVVVPSGNTLTFGGDNTDTLWDGTTSGGGVLAKVGTGKINIGVYGVIGDTLAISNGAVEINAAGDLGTASIADIYIDGGRLLDTTESAVTFIPAGRSIVLGASGGTIEIQSASAVTLHGGSTVGSVTPFRGGTLIKDGPGELRTYNVEHSFSKLIVKGGLYTAGHSTYSGYNTSFGAIPATLTPDAITLQNGGQIRKAGGVSVNLDPNQGISLGAGGGTIRSYGGDVDAGTFEIPGPISGSGPLVVNAVADANFAPNVVFSGNNTYSGGTTVAAGTNDVRVDGGLGVGNVTVASGAVLKLSSGTANTYINSAATLTLNGASPLVDLAFTGTPNTIKALYIGGSQMAAGTWGAIGSGAAHESALFAGAGMLNVTTGNAPQPVGDVTIGPVSGGTTSISYAGGTGTQFVLLKSLDVAAPMSSWTRVATNTATSGSFPISVGSDPRAFYLIKSE